MTLPTDDCKCMSGVKGGHCPLQLGSGSTVSSETPGRSDDPELPDYFHLNIY